MICLGFAFPGFDSQVFDVGKLAVVSPWQFFATDHMSFQEADWDGNIIPFILPLVFMTLYSVYRNDGH
jgi:hypothetical protein